MDDEWLSALPKLIMFVLIILFLLALGPVGWLGAFAYAWALFKD